MALCIAPRHRDLKADLVFFQSEYGVIKPQRCSGNPEWTPPGAGGMKRSAGILPADPPAFRNAFALGIFVPGW